MTADMFDNRWDNWAGDFSESFAAAEFAPAVRDQIPAILDAFGAAARARDPGFPDDLSPGTLAHVMTEVMPRLNLPAEARVQLPEVVAAFLENLRDVGRLGEGSDWAAQVRILGKSYRERLRPEGGAKGVPIRKPAGVSPVGRNDPCPCGSGKKYKKCCLAG